MARPAHAATEPGITRDLVVETALQLVEEYDVSALTMRRLATELGTAVTAIYWHVGNRDALLDLMVEQLLADMRRVRIGGRTPRARITSLCRQWRQRLWDHPHLIAIAHERGQTATMFQPMQAALASELRAVGLHGHAAGIAIRSLQFHVVASVVMERTAGRGPATDVTDVSVWADPNDPELVAALSGPVDYRQVFDVGLHALLDHSLLDHSLP